MSERLKKILLVSAFILAVLGIATGLYFAFFRKAGPAPEQIPPAGEEPSGVTVLPPSGAGVPVPTAPGAVGLPVSDIAKGGATKTQQIATAVNSTTISQDGASINFYKPEDGLFYRSDAAGNITKLSSQKFPNAKNIAWDSSGQQAVIEFPDGANIVYNFQTGRQFTLPEHWEDFDFSANGSQIVAKSIGIDPGNRWLVVASSDGSTAKSVVPLGTNADKVTVSWSPNDAVIGFSRTGSVQTGFARQQILPLGMNNENFKGLIVEGLNFHPKWSPSGEKILYDISGELSDYKPLLWVVDGSPSTMGDNRRGLGIRTWADKCAFQSNTTLYCAVPNSMPDGSGLQRELARGSNETIYKIDLDTYKITTAGFPENGGEVNNPTVSSDGGMFYYTDSQGALMQMRLK
ncbi:MAG: hypothetical protein ACD_76C00041G0005 [uncultured bacterium]|nr:MAG: hypothetical protein ACD_76C00041G0005 [uncultured bacterium]HBD05448.1 hypothetical protein [Candidatus Uhrbacteria bacterium]